MGNAVIKAMLIGLVLVCVVVYLLIKSVKLLNKKEWSSKKEGLALVVISVFLGVLIKIGVVLTGPYEGPALILPGLLFGVAGIMFIVGFFMWLKGKKE